MRFPFIVCAVPAPGGATCPGDSMKKIAFAVSILALSAFAASAADLQPRYSKAPLLAPVSAYNWTGFYIGANAGYGWAGNDHDDLIARGGLFTTGGTQRVEPTGGVYGGQIGYNWQFGNWVLGVEVAGDGTSLRRTDRSIFFPATTDTLTSEINGLFTATERVGYAFNNWLPYIKGGYAGTNLRTRNFDNIGGLNILEHKEWRNGFTVGAGIEYGITPNWTAGVEYAYMNFGEHTWVGPNLSFGPETFKDTLEISTITARLNYRFGGPVVARY